MQYLSTLIAVHDMQASKKFYTELLGMKITLNLDDINVVLEDRIALQTIDSWADFCDTTPDTFRFGGGQFELYFEEEDLDAFLEKLAGWPEVKRLGGVKTFPWGQRSLKILDPDEHWVEVGESMKTVAKRYLLEGLSNEETQKRVQYPMPFVLMCRAELEAEGKL